MNVVRLPRAIVDQLLEWARQSPDEEICGLVSRDQSGFKKCYAIANIAADKKHFFIMEPQAQIVALRDMREQGATLAAIYHSHPDTPALPSATDIKQHQYSDVPYLIISLVDGMPTMRGFYIRDGKAQEIAINIEK